MHGLGHSLGLGVHDLAPQNGPFEPGWVVTVEPGIYIPEEGIGIRLENDVLVTPSGPVDLAAHIPIDPDAVERLLAKSTLVKST
jgi:Xaa-Pro aminopeptidase